MDDLKNINNMGDLIDVKANDQINWRDWFQTLILLGMAAYLAVLVVTGNLSNYINIRFQWLTYVAIVVFGVLGAWNAYALFRGGSDKHLKNAAFDHVPVSWGAIAIAAIPLLLATLIPSRPLDASAINSGVSLNPVGGAATFSLAPEDRNILDWLREFSRTDNPATLNGLPVDVIGFVYREPGMAEDQFMLARFTMSCCVADAFAIGMPVQYANTANLQEGEWVHIRGTLEAGEFEGRAMPIIQPSIVEPTDEPDTPYLYS